MTGDNNGGHGRIDTLDATWRAAVRRKLLRWFDQHARDLPWRRNPTPYRVWVSEIMLQQTQVATVVDYYLRFMERFPDVSSLAEADEETLMRFWEGLGYYRRARLMHQAAKEVVTKHNAQFPVRYADVLSLPGVGRYTAGAVLSIATDAAHPILEGNTQRVFSRWVAMKTDVKSKAGMEALWTLAEQMLPRRGAGKFNQAAMELGALVCKPIAPQCHACPVAELCEANRQGLQDEIPGKVTRIIYQDKLEFAFLIPSADQTRWLVRRIGAGERWAGLWDFPRVTDDLVRNQNDAVALLTRRLGLESLDAMRLGALKHAVTKYRITLELLRTSPVHQGDLTLDPAEFRFVTPDELVGMPLNVTGRKIARQWLHQAPELPLSEELPARKRRGGATRN